jgi:hypothetical protein
MESFETLKFIDKDNRDRSFERLKHGADSTPQEKQAIKYSDVEAEFYPTEDEFNLDEKGRVRYHAVYFVAYPKDIHGHRVRALAERDKE